MTSAAARPSCERQRPTLVLAGRRRRGILGTHKEIAPPHIGGEEVVGGVPHATLVSPEAATLSEQDTALLLSPSELFGRHE